MATTNPGNCRWGTAEQQAHNKSAERRAEASAKITAANIRRGSKKKICGRSRRQAMWAEINAELAAEEADQLTREFDRLMSAAE
jgi:hypothetical protein